MDLLNDAVGQPERLLSLLSQGHDPNAAEEQGVTPLEDAVWNYYTSTLYLLQHNADPNVKHVSYNLKHRSPLHGKLYLDDTPENIKTVKLLLDYGANPNQRTRLDRTPLHCHVHQVTGTIENIQHFLSKGADVNAKDNVGWTPLHYAVYNPYDGGPVIRMLVDHGADPHTADTFGITPLHRAAEWRYGICACDLIDPGYCDIFDQGPPLCGCGEKDEDDDYVLPLFSYVQDNTALLVLLEKGCDPNVQDKHGRTPLHFAAQNSNVSGEHVKTLLEHGTDVNILDCNALNPLVYCSWRKGDVLPLAKLLLEALDFKYQDEDGDTALHLFARGNHPKALQLLLDNGADVNAVNKIRSTPAHEVVWEDNCVENLGILMAHGAHTDCVNSEGETPMDILKYRLDHYDHEPHVNDEIEACIEFLESQLPLPLRCLCAHNLSPFKHQEAFRSMLPPVLMKLVDSH